MEMNEKLNNYGFHLQVYLRHGDLCVTDMSRGNHNKGCIMYIFCLHLSCIVRREL